MIFTKEDIKKVWNKIIYRFQNKKREMQELDDKYEEWRAKTPPEERRKQVNALLNIEG